MTDERSAIIEAAVNALPSFWHPDDKLGTARAVVAAVTPLIEAKTLERAASLLDAEADAYRKTSLVPELVSAVERLAAAMRDLKERP